MGRLGLKKQAAQWKVVQLWPQIVGDSLAKIARPLRVIQGALYVATSSSSWANELDFRKTEILSLIKEHLGETGIRDIRFQSTAWKVIDNDAKPTKKLSLGASDAKRIQAIAEKIEHPAVRQAFEKVLIQHALRARKNA